MVLKGWSCVFGLWYYRIGFQRWVYIYKPLCWLRSRGCFLSLEAVCLLFPKKTSNSLQRLCGSGPLALSVCPDVPLVRDGISCTLFVHFLFWNFKNGHSVSVLSKEE